MKYSFFRILRDWTFWVVILLSILFVIGYTFFFVKTCQPEKHEWYYNVRSYSSVSDLEKQIAQNRELLKQIDAEVQSSSISERNLLNDERQWVSASVEILSFLKDNINTYNYSDLIDSQLIYSYEKNPVSYYDQCIEMLFFFQIIAMIFIVGQIVNQEKTTGSFILPLMMRGRHKVFERQLLSSLVVFLTNYLIQLALIGTLSTLFSEDEKSILYYSQDGITVLSEKQDFLLMGLHMLLILITFWTLIFCISQIVDNVLLFSVISIVACTCPMLFLYSQDSGLLSKFNYPISDVLTDSLSGSEQIVIFIIKAVLSALLLWASFIVAKRKNYRIKYE